MELTPVTVTQINEYIRSQMDRDSFLRSVAVRGEISNYKLYPSGHHYFTLKDDGGTLKAVMFKGNAFRLKFRPENGMKVIAFGSVSVYPRDGVYQLYCTALNADGLGDLHIAFEQLKRKLSALGLFDPAHKKPIPKYPQTIGIITSSAGAALRDMLRILRKRYPLAKVRLLPARVQGTEAAGEIAAAIAFANQHHLADVLIVGRGGGSIEDLWAFNEEPVAYGIYGSEIPVISAVGHEPDVTISDYVADLRAATPSNAAELAVPDQDALRQMLDSYSASMVTALQRQIKTCRIRLHTLSSGAALKSPDGYIQKRRVDMDALKTKLISGYAKCLNVHRQRFTAQTSKLDAMSPLKVLTRGYCVTQKSDGAVVSSVNQVNHSDQLNIVVSDGTICAVVK